MLRRCGVVVSRRSTLIVAVFECGGVAEFLDELLIAAASQSLGVGKFSYESAVAVSESLPGKSPRHGVSVSAYFGVSAFA